MKRFKIFHQDAIYHCMSRTAGKQLLFGDREKEVLRKMIWQVADFCGVEVLTYAVMGNHFHVLARVPHSQTISDAELVRRFATLYPKPSLHQPLTPQAFDKFLRNGGPEAEKLRNQLRQRMGDISAFMKTLKQRFSIWYNQTHARSGTLWAERFKSVLVEGRGNPLQTMAAYIDLNPVRAGLASDPKDYRFCGYGEAVAGKSGARRGLSLVWADRIIPTNNYDDALRAHRSLIFAKGEFDESFSREEAVRVLEREGGILPKPTVLRCRVRYFTDGAILGSEDFVRAKCEGWRRERGRKHLPKANPLVGSDWGDLTTIVGLRKKVFS